MIVNEDCIKHLKTIEDNYFDSVVTDPPYELGFMGKIWDSTGIAFTTELWKEVYRTLKPGGYLLSFAASRNYHRMAVAIEDSGFEIRDQIMWIYGSGFPKSLNIGKALDKKQGNKRKVVGTRISAFGDADGSETDDGRNLWGKESTKEVELTKGDSEWEGWGTALKPAHEPIVMARKLLSESNNVANVLKHGTGGINIDGCRVDLDGDKKQATAGRRTIKWGVNEGGSTYEKGTGAVYTETGRFPANIMHDGLQEDWARYFYSPKVSKSERGEDNTHPTVKPQELMKYLCRLVTPKGGIVLDPFMGSGSTGMAAKDEGFEFIGIEREKKYFEIAEKRIQAASPLMEFM